MLAIGMFGSAALNVLFGFSTGFYFLLFVWATNGFCQSLGWTPCVRVAANWVPVARRGHAIGIIGTGYQITLGLTFRHRRSGGRASWLARRAVCAGRAAGAGRAVHAGVSCAKRRPSSGQPHDERTSRSTLAAHAQLSFSEGLYWTLYNPALWLLGCRSGLLNACRYGFSIGA